MTANANSPTPELVVVVPAYGVGDGLRAVVARWITLLDGLGMSYAIHIYNDGSRDHTGAVLDELARIHPAVQAHHQANRGHGPTVLQGYLDHAKVPWIFQIDSDDEMGPSYFPALWRARHDFDLLCGYRVKREIAAYRRAISAVGAWSMRWLFGRGMRDVNVPYRLMRMACFRPYLTLIPRPTISPNTLLAGASGWGRMRILEVPVEERPQARAERPRKTWGWARVAVLSFLQSLQFQRACRRTGVATRGGPCST